LTLQLQGLAQSFLLPDSIRLPPVHRREKRLCIAFEICQQICQLHSAKELEKFSLSSDGLVLPELIKCLILLAI